jgi:hypothetical protein
MPQTPGSAQQNGGSSRARYDAETTVAVFAARLKDAVDLDAGRDDLASMVQTPLEAAHISMWTSERD